MANKILILGAKGGLGQQLVKVFNSEDEVIAWDKQEIDITDQELIFKKVEDIKPEIIINAAAYNAVDKCENQEEFELAKKINGEAVGYLANAALKGGFLFVHYSTNYVFDGKKKAGYLETDQPRPINNYGKSKLLGEQALLKLTGQGLKWYLIRTSKLFGPPGESEQAKPSFFDQILKSAPKEKQIEVVNQEVSCFTYTPDLATATKKLIESDQGYGIYHLTNSGACTWYQAAKELFNLAGVDIKVIPISSDELKRPARRPKYSILINTKLPPLRDYREALAEYLKI